MGNCCIKVDPKKARSGLKPPSIIKRPLLAPVCAKSDVNSPNFPINRYIDSDTLSTATKYDCMAPQAESEVVEPLTGSSSKSSVSSSLLFRSAKPSRIPSRLPIKTNLPGMVKDVSKADQGLPFLPEENSIKLKHRFWQSSTDVDDKKSEKERVGVVASRPTSMYAQNSSKEPVGEDVSSTHQPSNLLTSELSLRSDDLMLDVDIALTPLTATDIKESQVPRHFFPDIAKQSSFEQEDDSLSQFRTASLRRLRSRGRSYNQKIFQQSLSETAEANNDDIWTVIDRSGLVEISSDDQRHILQSLSGMKLSLLKWKRVLNENQDQNVDSPDPLVTNENSAPASHNGSPLFGALGAQVHMLTLENLALKQCLSEKDDLIAALRLQNDVTSTTND